MKRKRKISISKSKDSVQIEADSLTEEELKRLVEIVNEIVVGDKTTGKVGFKTEDK